MTQMQAAILDLMATTTMSGSNAGAPKVASANSKLRFDQLLGQARTSLASICQEAGLTEAVGGDAVELGSECEEFAKQDFGMLAALLAQPRLTMLTAQPDEQDSETVSAAGDNLPASEIPDGVPIDMLTEDAAAEVKADTDAPDSFLRPTVVKAEPTAAVQVEPTNTGQQGAKIAAAGPLAELLAQLRAEAPEVFTEHTRAQADSEVRPERWGQLERYWLLREPQEAEAEVEPEAQLQQPAALTLDLDPPEPAVVAGKNQPSRGATEVSTPKIDLAAVARPAAEHEQVAPQGSGKPFNQFAAYLDLVADSVPASDIAEPAEVSYTARPGAPLEQQLEQGLTVGLRQLRLLRSPEGITVRMQLYPESLGEVRVELKMEGNMLTAQLRALQPQTTGVLRLELPLLRENLVNQGFTQVFLGAETAEYFGQSAGREQQRLQEEQARRPQRVGIVKTETAEELEPEQPTQGLDYRL